ncbi:septal ring lytic transglycosylase RlpA family protein [Nonomuraea sp. MTCD27]|uniref:septal ring lytic transglycosylase RlpA family protein n=1 Tax=Nonomuraea sp. MTCD27 TaxID=1676747 RepID=UPI0035C14267
MGQHSRTPSPQDRKAPASKRRWTTVAAGAAVLAAASTTAWAAIGNDDSPKRTAVVNPPPFAPGTARTTPNPAAASNEAARHHTPKPSSPAPKPPAAAQPNATASPATTRSPQPAKTTAPAKTSATPESSETAETSVRSRTTKPKFRVLSSGACGASYYGEPQMTASGERFNPAAMTAAHKTLPLGSKVRVTNPNSGDSVTVRINDRGPYIGGRCLDLSRAAFAAIGNISAGVMRVKYEVLGR